MPFLNYSIFVFYYFCCFKSKWRQGPAISVPGAKSWLNPSASIVFDDLADLNLEQCPLSQYVTTQLLINNPDLRQSRVCHENGHVTFESPFQHFNYLISFNSTSWAWEEFKIPFLSKNPHPSFLKPLSRLEYPSIRNARACPVGSGKKLLLFGINSVPENRSKRDALRKTWLNEQFWRFPDVEIHHVFLLGTNGVEIDKGELEQGDIVQWDFDESLAMALIFRQKFISSKFFVIEK